MKEGIRKYVRIIRRLYIAFTVLALAAFMISMVFAFNRVFAFYFIAPAIFLAWVIVYGFYEMRVSMGAVIGIELTKEVVHLKTQRKTYTYDREGGCVKVKVYRNKFVCTFAADNARDSFIFYRRVLFSPYSMEQFTAEEIASFYPAVMQCDLRQR